MNKFLTNLVAKLPVAVQPYVKAFVPVVLAGFVVLQDLVVSAEEVNELKTLAAGAVVSLIVYVFPNLAK